MDSLPCIDLDHPDQYTSPLRGTRLVMLTLVQVVAVPGLQESTVSAFVSTEAVRRTDVILEV